MEKEILEDLVEKVISEVKGKGKIGEEKDNLGDHGGKAKGPKREQRFGWKGMEEVPGRTLEEEQPGHQA